MDFPKIIMSAGVTTAFAMVIVGQHCHLFPNPYVGARSVCEITAPHEFKQPESNSTSPSTSTSRIISILNANASGTTMPLYAPTPSPEA